MPQRNTPIEQFRDWFDLQLDLVDVLVEKCGLPLNQAISDYTNIRRRLVFEHPGENTPPEWDAFVETLSLLKTRHDKIGLVCDFGRDRILSDSPPDRPEFGCFNFSKPNNKGEVRIHFAVNDVINEKGPLHSSKIDVRRSELAVMFRHIKRNHDDTAQHVTGASWLYNLEAYRRIFPREFSKSRFVKRSENMKLTGTSFWGQFLDHEDKVKPEIRDQYVRNLDTINMKELWRLFPLPLMVTRAPIEQFYGYYSEFSS